MQANQPRCAPLTLWRLPALELATLALLLTLPAAAANPCADCHEEQVVAYAKGPHRGVAGDGAILCTACHGDGAAHLASGEASDIRGPAALAEWDTVRQAEACISCHGVDFPAASQSPHWSRVSCWSCHAQAALHGTPPGPRLAEAHRHETFALCTSCHAEAGAELRLEYRHPVAEGLVDCTDCHDVHGRSASSAAGSLATRGACASCHQEQHGPYLFEHQAVTDGCTSCHRPHGSWNRSLLASTGNGVCLSCHLQSNFPGVGKIPHDFRLSGGARCWDCHSDVHGSNTTPDFNPRGRR